MHNINHAYYKSFYIFAHSLVKFYNILTDSEEVKVYKGDFNSYYYYFIILYLLQDTTCLTISIHHFLMTGPTFSYLNETTQR